MIFLPDVRPREANTSAPMPAPAHPHGKQHGGNIHEEPIYTHKAPHIHGGDSRSQQPNVTDGPLAHIELTEYPTCHPLPWPGRYELNQLITVDDSVDDSVNDSWPVLAPPLSPPYRVRPRPHTW